MSPYTCKPLIMPFHDGCVCDSSHLCACKLGSEFRKIKTSEYLIFRFLEPICEILSPLKFQRIRHPHLHNPRLSFTEGGLTNTSAPSPTAPPDLLQWEARKGVQEEEEAEEQRSCQRRLQRWWIQQVEGSCCYGGGN